jgi:hypothetical protein
MVYPSLSWEKKWFGKHMAQKRVAHSPFFHCMGSMEIATGSPAGLLCNYTPTAIPTDPDLTLIWG